VPGDRPEGTPLGVPRRHQEERVEGDEREPVCAGAGQVELEQVRLDELQSAAGAPAGRCGPGPGPLEHRRIEVHRRDVEPGRGERDGDPAAACRELEDRAAGAGREGPVEVDISRIVDEIEVVQAGQRAARRGRLARRG